MGGFFELLFNARDLIFVDVGVVDDIGHLSWAQTCGLSEQVAKHGVLRNVKWHTKRYVVTANGNHKVKLARGNVPLSVPDAGRQGGGFEPLVLPKRHNKAAVGRVGFKGFD